MKKLFLLLPILSLCLLRCSSGTAVTDTAATSPAGVLLIPQDKLEGLRERFTSGTPAERLVLQQLIERADAEIGQPPYTVVHKEILPPSNDPHDYLSLAPYWWPDPEQEDGLPWIRRDGEVNPVTRGENTDKTQRGYFFAAMSDHAFAHFLTGAERYARRADTLLQTWFLASETRMNPHLDYAQGIPGAYTGRCYGIIELRGMMDLVTDLQLLKMTGGLDPATEAGVKGWMEDYLEWLLTSPLGVEEGNRLNNHATWYDGQVLTLQLYLGKSKEARRTAEGVKRRIGYQIAADGSQPEELARTKTLSYSTMNLRAFTDLAQLARRVDVDLWSYKSEAGAGLQEAYAFLQPYAAEERPWTMPQLGDPDSVLEETQGLFARAGSLFGVPEYCSIADQDRSPATLEDVLYSCQP